MSDGGGEDMSADFIDGLSDLPAEEGFIDFEGNRTWYRSVGTDRSDKALPLLCLHGGPGAGWHHLEPYQALAGGRRVIFYDQIGCGRSVVSSPHDPSMWNTDLFVREVDAVRLALGLDQCHILGHSWGGMLALAYAIGRPSGIASLLIESSPASVPFWLEELDVLRSDLPSDVEETLRRHEAAGTTSSTEYQDTMMVFYDRHVCRVRPWPKWLERCFAQMEENPEVYNSMNGPSEFHVIGPLKDFDIRKDLGAIAAPTLLFCGEFDEVTPATMRVANDAIKGSKLVVLPGCSHMSQAERPDLVMGMVQGWLSAVDSSSQLS